MAIPELLFSIPATLFVPQFGQHHETYLLPLQGRCYRTAAACDREYIDYELPPHAGPLFLYS